MPVVGVEQAADAIANLVANLADASEVLSFRILERPIVATQTGNDRTLIPASHCDQHLRLLRQRGCQLRGRRSSEVDADLAHRSDNFRMDARTWFRARRDGPRL